MYCITGTTAIWFMNKATKYATKPQDYIGNTNKPMYGHNYTYGTKHTEKP